MISENDLGWLAGIIDFQGHIVYKNNKQRASSSVQAVLYVETRVEEIIAKLCSLTGNTLEPHEQSKLRPEWTRRGCEEHCPEAHVHVIPVSIPDVYKWTVSGASMAIVLWNLRDRMCTTREPWGWAVATALSSTRLTGQGSGAAMSAIRRMERLGWQLPPLMREAIRRGQHDIRVRPADDRVPGDDSGGGGAVEPVMGSKYAGKEISSSS
jgi:hypothetical protein